jgi:hypothetical protein
MKEEIVILNIDHTMADMPERIHHLQKKPLESIFPAMGQDRAIRSGNKTRLVQKSAKKDDLSTGYARRVLIHVHPRRLARWRRAIK